MMYVDVNGFETLNLFSQEKYQKSLLIYNNIYSIIIYFWVKKLI